MAVVLTFAPFFIISMSRSERFYLKDNISSYSVRSGSTRPPPAEAMFAEGNKRFDFKAYINNENFDNDDNPYGRFVMHQYTSMANINDTEGEVVGFLDKEIPMIECPGAAEAWKTGIPKYYCPDFDESHHIHGAFWAPKFSWLRLAIHVCDSSKEAKAKRTGENKECKTEQESFEYFEKHIIGLETISKEASIEKKFSQNLYFKNESIREKQGNLIVDSKRDV